jgi:outer membrane protein assembly factor BamE
MRRIVTCLFIILSLQLIACTSILENLPGVYKLEIQQGNIVNQKMIDQIRPNMTERQVLYILGSPMLVDTFRQKRWDYIYSNQPSGEDREQKKISLFFDENNEVASIQGDFKPSATKVTATSDESTVDVPKRDIEKTMWQKITGLFGFDDIDDSPRKDPDAKPDATGSQFKKTL